VCAARQEKLGFVVETQMKSWSSPEDRRPPRKYYGSVASPSGGRAKRKRETACFTWLAVSGCLFLVVSLAALIFFLSQSDLELTSSASDPSEPVLGRLQECKVDADCDTCCAALRGDLATAAPSLNPCLLPTNRSHPHVCVGECCVPAPPLWAPDDTPCDDGKWCTYGDRCASGECVGVARDCQDADFCTVEECSERFRTCVRADYHDVEACREACADDHDCRTGYYCLPSGQCGKLPDTDATLRFTHYEIERCEEAPAHVYSMTQHYVTYEKAYVGPQGNLRYRVVDHVQLPLLHNYNPHRPVFDPSPEGVPLVEVHGISETRVVELGNATYSQTTLTLRTACQQMDPTDLQSCSTAWADRQYNFEIAHKDCVRGDGTGAAFHDCLPSRVTRAYTMFLSIVDCPFIPHTVVIKPVPSLRLESPSAPGVAITELVKGLPFRAFFWTDQSGWLDPFFVDVTVCVVDASHRLAPCATNEQEEDCPFRGCHGWSPQDTPVVSTRNYLVDSEFMSAAQLDGVVFCRDKLKYDEGGCEAGPCGWGNFTGQQMAALGGVDAFEYVPLKPIGTLYVVDVRARLEACQAYADGQADGQRRLQSQNTGRERLIGSLRIVQ
jgi:hypothetical protein